MKIIELLIAAIALVSLILKACFEKDAELKKKKNALHEEAKSAIKSGDVSSISSVFERIRLLK